MQVGVSGRGRCRLTRIAALFLCAVLAHAVHAQAPPPGVFTEVQTAIAQRPRSALEPATVRSRVVQLDTQKITAARRGREVLTLNLFDDAVLQVQIKRVRPTRTGYFISGTPKGKEWGEVRLVVNGPVMAGTVQTPEGTFTIRSGGRGRHVIRQLDPSKISFECTVEDVPVVNPATESDLPAISSIGPQPAGADSPRMSQVNAAPTEDGSEIRVLVIYRPAVENEHGGAAGIRALIDLMIQSANQAFEDSGINPRLALAHSARWRTLMAYNNRCSDADFHRGCKWLLRFSNPDQTHLGDPLGIPGRALGRSSVVFQAITKAAGYDNAERCDEVTENDRAGHYCPNVEKGTVHNCMI